MDPFNPKPDFNRYFYENYFIPTQQQMPKATLAEVLDVAKQKLPFEVKISEPTLLRIRARR